MTEIFGIKSREEFDASMGWEPYKEPFKTSSRNVIIRLDFGNGDFEFRTVHRSCYKYKESSAQESQEYYASQARAEAEKKGTTFVRLTCYPYSPAIEESLINEVKRIDKKYIFRRFPYEFKPEPTGSQTHIATNG
ncbi:MAG: hypothetical protein U9Q67_01445 [Patescibacteria group bacterium]|nr:hypothetical protein [Patescibacteria group bacterium]